MSAEISQFATSRIVGATVFSDAAHVTRRASIQGSAGLQRVVLEGLPPGVDPSTMRASTTFGLVRSIEMDIISKKKAGVSETAHLQSAIEALEGKSRRIAGEIVALEAEIALIDQIVPTQSPSAGPAGAPPLRPEVFVAGLEVLTARRRDAVATLRSAQAELRGNEDELNAVRDRIAQVGLTGDAGDKHAALVVAVETSAPGECIIDLTYQAAWATWRPYYHIRLQPKENLIECVRFADVWQETLEDWTEVTLRLSTAEPESSLRLPTVLPWTLGVAKGFEDKLGDLYAQRKRRMAAPSPQAKMRRSGAPPRAGAMLGGAPGSAPMPFPAPRMVARAATPASVVPTAYAQSELDATVEPREITQIEVGADGGGGGGGSGEETGELALSEFEDYERQFEEEGEFADRTAAGLVAMRARDDARVGSADRIADFGAAVPSDTSRFAGGPSGPPVPPASRHTRSFGADHPDFVRLSQSTAPKDAAGGINHEFEVGTTTTCRSGKERNRLSFGSVTYPAKIEYLLRPGVKDHAFGRVTVVNNEGVPLLEGPAAIFVRDAFFGETRIRTTPSGGKLILDLGAETAIKSARRSKTTVRTEGILTKEDVHVVEVGIDIENHLTTVADLEVQDQVPVSLDPKVKVRLMKTSPKDANLDELTGIITFRLRLAPGARTEINLSYEIEAPKDYQFIQTLRE